MTTDSFSTRHRSYLSRQDGIVNVTSSRTRLITACGMCFMIITLLFSACASSPSKDDENKAEARNAMGYSYLSKGQLNKAFIEFQKAIQLNPKNREAFNYLGYVSYRFKKYDEAISYYQQAIAIDPGYSDALNNLAVTYVETSEWDKAISHFNAVLRDPLYSSPAGAYSNLGYVYYRKGDYPNAEKALKEALIRNPVFPMAIYIRGLVFVATGNDDEAAAQFRKAIGILPDYLDAHWELAKTYVRSGSKARALKHFNVVLENEENLERRREASEYIERLKY